MEVVGLVPDVEPLPHEGLGPRKLQSWKRKSENEAQREKKKSNLINIQLSRKHQDEQLSYLALLVAVFPHRLIAPLQGRTRREGSLPARPPPSSFSAIREPQISDRIRPQIGRLAAATSRRDGILTAISRILQPVGGTQCSHRLALRQPRL
jgi:hypothetical protein